MRASTLLACVLCTCALWATLTQATAMDVSSALFAADAESLAAESLLLLDPAIVDRPLSAKRISTPSTVQKGGPLKAIKPDMSKGKADGSVLPPYDPFHIARRHNKVLAERQAKRQAVVDVETRIETCRQMKRRERKRLAAEKREREEEAAERAREAAEKAADKKADSGSFMEVESGMESGSESELLSELDAEMEADAEQEALDNAEAEADAEQAESDYADMEAELESESEADAEADSDASLAETASNDIVIDAKPKRTHATPSLHVTYNREDLLDETFDNKDSRAVFARRARGKEIVRFSKLHKSDGGLAVVNGVTKLPCGKEITDKGLFQPVIQNHLTATVEAANPVPYVWRDDNVAAIKAFPVVPQYKEVAGVDEYGDGPNA